jgi:Replication protein A interacting C-terminal
MTTRGPHRQTRITQQRTQLHEHWKDSLRQACVARARKNRKYLIWKKRHLPAEEVTNTRGFTTPRRSCNDDVRSLVEHELRQQGVAVATPAASHCDYLEACGAPHSPPHQQQQQQQQQHNQPMDDPLDQSWLLEDSHVLSEEELYELMQEVEEELRRSEEELVEEVLEEEERWHMEDIDQQVAHYEEWEESLAMSSDENIVICPICCEAFLRQHSPTEIECSNDACHFHITGQTLSLPDLKERLRSAFDEHSSLGCSCTLTIDIHNNTHAEDPMEGCGHLFGSCHKCDALMTIA